MASKQKLHKTKLRVGDLVQVISGRGAAGLKRRLPDGGEEKERQKRGKILSIDLLKGTAIVQGLKIVFRHQKPTDPNNPQSGGRIEKEAPIHLSNLMLVDPEKDAPTRLGKKLVEGEQDGKKVTRRLRYAKLSGAEVAGGK